MTGNRRTAKVAAAIREVVSTTILFELRDPRVKNVTVLGVEVHPDLRSAKVHVSVMGEDKDIRLTMGGLTAARGFIQSRIAERIDMQYTPILTFVLDDGIKKSMDAERILRELAAERGELPATVDEVATADDAVDTDASLHDSNGIGDKPADD